jgi:hypothetical protein
VGGRSGANGVADRHRRDLPPGQGLPANQAKLRELLPVGSVVLLDEHWWLMDATEYTLYDIMFSMPPDLSRIDYVVLSGNGSGAPGVPRKLDARFAAYVAKHFQPIHDSLAREPFTFFGRRITNSAYGFGFVLMARKPGPIEEDGE